MLGANSRKWMVAGLCFAIIWIAAPNASAQRFDHATKITVNQPFEVPGLALPAGTYVMRLAEVAGTRTVVQILNADQTTSYAFVMGIPDYRLKTTEDTYVTFYEAKPGAPVPMRAWFYPGYNSGLEFVYPRDRALEIARTSGEHVIAAPYQPEYIPEPGEFEELDPALLTAIKPSGEEVDVAAVHGESEEAWYEEPVAEDDFLTAAIDLPAVTQLPRTGSPIPLFALAGLLSAGAAGLARAMRRRRS